MEFQKQATRVREAINKVIAALINPTYRIPGGGQSLQTIISGIGKINKELFPYSDMATDRIVDFFVYQLYIKRETRYRLTVEDIFSDYAIGKYRKQFLSEDGKSGINYYINLWLASESITRASLVGMIDTSKQHRLQKYVYLESEELIKKRFYGTDMGYMLCQRSTTGWAPQSDTCRQCRYSEECRTTTAKKFPELYRLRLQKN